ncbi:glutathione S-transferase, partial [Tremellales sp. Uapishka_1]
MSVPPKTVGKLWMYTAHSRWTRLQAVARASNVVFDHQKEPGMREAMSDKAFLAKFPMGMFPAFESADGKVKITECSAICDYIACLTPESGLMPTDPALAAQVRSWLLVCEAEIIAPLTVVNRAILNIVPYDEAMLNGIFEALHRRLASLNTYFSSHRYLVNDQFTLADLTMISVLAHGYAKFFDKEWQDKYPSVLEWFDKTRKEPKLGGLYDEVSMNEKAPVDKPKSG